jgi:hypothetical protein
LHTNIIWQNILDNEFRTSAHTIVCYFLFKDDVRSEKRSKGFFRLSAPDLHSEVVARKVHHAGFPMKALDLKTSTSYYGVSFRALLQIPKLVTSFVV